jgi:hypothetical protein
MDLKCQYLKRSWTLVKKLGFIGGEEQGKLKRPGQIEKCRRYVVAKKIEMRIPKVVPNMLK